MQDSNLFNEIFLSLEMWGYLGPMALVVAGYFLAKKEAILGIFMFIVDCLFVYKYLDMVALQPEHWWHVIILLLGGLFTCVYPLWDRR